MDRQTHGHTDTHMDTHMDRHRCTETHRHTQKQTQTHTGTHTDTDIHRHTYGHTHHTHVYTQTHRHTWSVVSYSKTVLAKYRFSHKFLFTLLQTKILGCAVKNSPLGGGGGGAEDFCARRCLLTDTVSVTVMFSCSNGRPGVTMDIPLSFVLEQSFIYFRDLSLS